MRFFVLIFSLAYLFTTAQPILPTTYDLQNGNSWYYNNVLNPKTFVSGCFIQGLLSNGFNEAQVQATVVNLYGQTASSGGSFGQNFVSIRSNLRSTTTNTNNISYQTFLDDKFIPEDISLINFHGGDDVFAIIVGKFLTTTGFDIALQVFKYDLNINGPLKLLPVSSIISIDNWPSGIYDFNSDDLVRIDDDGNSQFGIIYNNNGIINLITGELDPRIPDGVSLNSPSILFTGSTGNRPDIAILQYNKNAISRNPYVVCSAVLNSRYGEEINVYTTNYLSPQIGSIEVIDGDYQIFSAPRIAVAGQNDWAITYRSYKNYIYYYAEAYRGSGCNIPLNDLSLGYTSNGGIQMPLPGPDIVAVDRSYVIAWTQYDYSSLYCPNQGNGEPGFKVLTNVITNGCPSNNYIVSNNPFWPYAFGNSVTGYKNSNSAQSGTVGFAFHTGRGYPASFYLNSYFLTVDKYSNIYGVFVTAKKLKYFEENNSSKSEIILYPNPCSAYIKIINRPAESEVLIQDITGKALKIFKSSQNQLYVGDLSAGMYLLTIELNGMKLKSQFFVKRN
jgi:hypothetical protein